MVTIRELREARGWSPVKLAAELDVALATVYNWEAGNSEPLFSKARAIARLFDVPMDDLEFGRRDTARGPKPQKGRAE